MRETTTNVYRYEIVVLIFLRYADLETQHGPEACHDVSLRAHFSGIFVSISSITVTMKLAVIATLFASASAFGINKADLGKVRTKLTIFKAKRTCIGFLESLANAWRTRVKRVKILEP